MPSSPTKTPLRNEYLRALASVNDQMCLTLFMHEDVAGRRKELAVHRPAEFTSNVFPGNTFAERIYVPMTRLVEFREAQLNVSLGVSFAFAVEQLLLFVEAALRHWGEITGRSIPISDPIDESLQRAFAESRTEALDQRFIKTVKYLRLRRNHVIHGTTELSNEFSKFLRYDAAGLQKFWETRSSIPGLEFEKKQHRFRHNVLRPQLRGRFNVEG